MRIGIVGTGASVMRELLDGRQSEASIIDPIERVPDFRAADRDGNTLGRAWRCDLPALRRRLKLDPARDAAILQVVVEAKWANPTWHSYFVSLIHLRDIPGLRTIFYFADATHEIVVEAIDPGKRRLPIILGESPGVVSTLRPANFAAQIVEISDELAIERVEKAITMIVRGELSPDTDHRAAWCGLFGDNMQKDRPGGRFEPIVR